jgi:5,10-methylenetetrahydromethanopterin reductase
VTTTTRTPPAVGLVLGTAIAPERVPEAAATGERLGYDEIWLVEDYFFTGGAAAATAALAATERVPVGTGIVSGMVRHPAVLAMEIATIARMHPGRYLPGIGLGVPAWLDQMGVRPERTLTALRDSATAVRELLDGKTITRRDTFAYDRVKLAYPPTERVALQLGVLAAKGLRLSGEIADGTIFSVLAGEAYVAWARREIEAGREAARRREPHRVTALAIFSVDRDSRVAKRAVRSLLGFYLETSGRSPLTDAYGISDEVEELVRGGEGHLERAIPDRWLEDLVIAGDPDECAEKIRRLGAAGADSVVLMPTPFERALEVAVLAGEEVLPRLRSAKPATPARR